jgi:hypothetical protein
MTDREDAEKALHDRLAAQSAIYDLGGSIAHGTPYGTLVVLGERPIGLWSLLDGKFAFRDLASYQPAIEVDTAEEAVDVTIALLTLCRNGWAERFGPIAPASQEA